MRVLLPALLCLASALAAPASGLAEAETFQAHAFGTTTYRVTDAWTGAVQCDTAAFFTVDVGHLAGAAAWTPDDCPGATADAALFLLHCSDACFPGCRVRETEIQCHRWSNDGTTWTTEELTLHRDGQLAYVRETQAPDAWVRLDAQGILYVATWPAG